MGLFDGKVRDFAAKLVAALEEQASKRLEGNHPIVALTLIDIATVIKKVAELGDE